MNKIFMVGRLVEDPKPFTTQNGHTQARITIATQDNRTRSESYFFPCIA
jgi:single-stranded DNA-binding protein